MWLRRTASAYGRPQAAVHHLADASHRAYAVVTHADDPPILFQDKAMTMGDFLATWVVELAVHQLDLDVDRAPVGASLARRTLEAVAGADLPVGLSDAEAVLAGLGHAVAGHRRPPRTVPDLAVTSGSGARSVGSLP